MGRSRFLIFVFPGQGHINPGFQLAKRLLHVSAAEVTFLSGSSAISRISTVDLPPGFTLATFPDESLDFKNDANHYFSEIKRRSSECLVQLITEATLAARPYTYLLYATLLPWAVKVARDYHLPSSLLWVQPASVLAIFYYYFNGFGDAIRDLGNDPSVTIDLPGLPSLRGCDLPSFLLPSASSKDSDSVVRSVFMEHIQVLVEEETKIKKVLVNSFQGLEMDVIKSLTGLELNPVGPLIPSSFFLDRNNSCDADAATRLDLHKSIEGCIEWLDTKEESSVIYVSFGSYSFLSKPQMEELECALVQSGKPFLWVLRALEGKGNEEVLSRREELERNGMIVAWCSQLEVLSHPSVGCFVTHCGWNSSLESMVLGMPVVAFPLWADQTTNAKLIEDVWGVGIKAARDEEGIVRRGEIECCLETVMGGGEKGRDIRRNSLKWKEAAREAVSEGGSSDKGLKAFVGWVKD